MTFRNHLTIAAISFFCLAFSNCTSATGFPFKEKNDSIIEPDGSHYLNDRIYNVQLEYGNDRVNKGIKQVEMLPYLSPSFTYSALSGFTCGFSTTYLPTTKVFDEIDLNAGWDFKLSDESDAGASLSKFFYISTSPQAKSAISANINTYLKHDFEIIDSKLDFDLDIFKKKKKTTGISSFDYIFSFDNSHTFNIDPLSTKGDELIISPGITLTAGTQNVYLFYFEKLKKKSPDYVLTAADSSVSKFAFTGIEFYLPVEYEIGKFYVEPSVHYLVPENQPSFLNHKSYFYYEIAVGFDF